MSIGGFGSCSRARVGEELLVALEVGRERARVAHHHLEQLDAVGAGDERAERVALVERDVRALAAARRRRTSCRPRARTRRGCCCGRAAARSSRGPTCAYSERNAGEKSSHFSRTDTVRSPCRMPAHLLPRQVVEVREPRAGAGHRTISRWSHPDRMSLDQARDNIRPSAAQGDPCDIEIRRDARRSAPRCTASTCATTLDDGDGRRDPQGAPRPPRAVLPRPAHRRRAAPRVRAARSGRCTSRRSRRSTRTATRRRARPGEPEGRGRRRVAQRQHVPRRSADGFDPARGAAARRSAATRASRACTRRTTALSPPMRAFVDGLARRARHHQADAQGDPRRPHDARPRRDAAEVPAGRAHRSSSRTPRPGARRCS